MLLWLGQIYTTAATVDTDQIDYQPDTTATIDGSGFLSGETVELQVLNLTTPTDVGAEHDPWTTNADVNGNFETTWYVTADETNQTLELTATGLTSGMVAQRVFTDSATVTPANANISADTAADGASPAWTTLGNIKVAENNKGDFSAGTGVTLVIKSPTGWQFNTAATPKTTISGPEITAASTAVTDASTFTVTVTVTGNSKFQDIFTISGVQIMPTTGSTLSTGLHLYHPVANGGNWNINGISASSDGSSGTSFGGLTETAGAFAGYSISGNSSTTAGTSQNLTIQKVDQFGNAVNDRTTKTLTFSGLGSVGSNNPKINNATTAFTSGVSVAFNSSGLATTTISLIPYKAETATLDVTDGTQTSAAVGGGLALAVSAKTSSKLAFTSSAVTVLIGMTSANITVQRQDQFGNPVTAEGTRTVTLSSSSTGTVTFIPASLSIASGSSSATFTYTDTMFGTPTITVASSGLTSGTQQETITKPVPVAGSNTILRYPTKGVKVPVATLLSNDTAGFIAGVSANSANGGTVTLSQGWVYYTPATGFTNVDMFTYTLQDALGSTAVGTVTVAIMVDNNPGQSLTITDLGNGSFLINGDGIPGLIYRLQYAVSLSPAHWTNLPNSSLTANSVGSFQFTDTSVSGGRYYRSIYP